MIARGEGCPAKCPSRDRRSDREPAAPRGLRPRLSPRPGRRAAVRLLRISPIQASWPTGSPFARKNGRINSLRVAVRAIDPGPAGVGNVQVGPGRCRCATGGCSCRETRHANPGQIDRRVPGSARSRSRFVQRRAIHPVLQRLLSRTFLAGRPARGRAEQGVTSPTVGRSQGALSGTHTSLAAGAVGWEPFPITEAPTQRRQRGWGSCRT
jgi:hypothetical protein